MVSALVPYKRIEVAVQAAQQVGVPLKIVGIGPDRDRLARLAGPTVEFLGALPAEDLRDTYRRARALVLPAEEDFGIAPVEMMACGRPVIALARGGAVETVVPGETGWLVDTPDARTVGEAMRAACVTTFDARRVASHAGQFSVAQFEAAFRQLTESVVKRSLPC